MTAEAKNNVGRILWTDLTVTDAEMIRDFYRKTVGWNVEPVSMGDYEDYSMTTPVTGMPVAGICHARGMNASLPPGWLIYITVADLQASMQACREGGGEIVAGPTNSGPGSRFCIIRDPAGAHAALFEERIAQNDVEPPKEQ